MKDMSPGMLAIYFTYPPYPQAGQTLNVAGWLVIYMCNHVTPYLS